MTKVLLVAAKSDFNDQLQQALRMEGHTVMRINERGLAAHRWLWWVVRRVRILRQLRNHIVGREIIHMAQRFRPELVLVSKGTSIKLPTLQALKALGAKVANWFPENGRNEPYRSWLDRHVSDYDIFFSFDSELLARQLEFPHTRIIHLPLGVGPESFMIGNLTPEDHVTYDADICFVGACYPERVQVLSELQEWDLKIFGWKGWESTVLASRYGGPLSAHESARAYRCAKIVINMNLEPPVHGVNAKTFEICAAGGFQLTDWRADLPALFVEDRELVVFRTVSELKAKIRQYLVDASVRQKIADAGHERVMRDHTMRNRVRTIIDSL
jgi:spore maturation protein CgeB